MASVPRDGLPEFWCTKIAKVLVGDQPCLLEPWLSGHYKLEKRKRDDSGFLVKWKADHSALLQETTRLRAADGWDCRVESFFKVKGQTAILTGKTDLILQKANFRPCIVDVKTGTPKDSDTAQVLIEMIAIPMAWESPSMIFNGEVVYVDHTVKLTPDQAEAIKPKVFALLKHLGMARRPDASPSQGACRFCDVTDAECQQRWKDEKESTVSETVLF